MTHKVVLYKAFETVGNQIFEYYSWDNEEWYLRSLTDKMEIICDEDEDEWI